MSQCDKYVICLPERQTTNENFNFSKQSEINNHTSKFIKKKKKKKKTRKKKVKKKKKKKKKRKRKSQPCDRIHILSVLDPSF